MKVIFGRLIHDGIGNLGLKRLSNQHQLLFVLL